MNMRYILVVSFLLTSTFIFAQKDSTSVEADSLDKYIHFYNENDPLMEFSPEEKKKDFKKKKMPKKLFYGIKTKKGFTKQGYGEHLEMEIFYYIPTRHDPIPNVREIYVFNFKNFEVQRVRKIEDEDKDLYLLHGPYKKVLNGVVIEKGIYNKGVKHGRWEKYAKPKEHMFKDTIEVEEQVLLSKDKYNLGWPKDSELEYWDAKNTKLKEGKPIVEGQLHGSYVAYYESGRLKLQGTYMNGYKAGTWLYFYDKGSRTSFRHLMVKFNRNPLLNGEEGVILKEWNEKGEIVFDFDKANKSSGGKTEKRLFEESMFH